MLRKYRLLALLTGVLIAIGHAPELSGREPGALQSHQEIRETVSQFVSGRLRERTSKAQITVSRLDSRLRLQRCDQPLETFLTPGSRNKVGRITVGVRCSGNKPWSIYVPATVRLTGKVVVAARDLPRGTLLGEDDIELVERDLAANHRSYVLDAKEVLGKQLKRPLRRGRLLSTVHLARPETVKRGSEVTILAQLGSIEVRMKGRALRSGGIGDRIRVENLASHREVEARIVSAARVRVEM